MGSGVGSSVGSGVESCMGSGVGPGVSSGVASCMGSAWSLAEASLGSLSSSLGLLWPRDSLGALWELFGDSLGLSGNSLGALWGLTGDSLNQTAAHLDSKRSLGSPLGALWGLFGALWDFLGTLGGLSGTLLELFGGSLGALWGLSGASLEAAANLWNRSSILIYTMNSSMEDALNVKAFGACSTTDNRTLHMFVALLVAFPRRTHGKAICNGNFQNMLDHIKGARV